MSHVKDDLYAYLLDELSSEERARVEAHLQACAECRRELERLDEAFVEMVEALPPEAPPSRVWERIEQRIGDGHEDTAQPVVQMRSIPPLWAALAVAASLIVASVGVFWGIDQRQELNRLQAEQSIIVDFLAREGVTARPLPIDAPQHGGSVLFDPAGGALVVMRSPAPPNRSYQAWGISGDRVESLGVVDARALRIATEGFDVIAVSLEPEGGSPTPTEVLGGVPTS